jgi:hypothetical protein
MKTIPKYGLKFLKKKNWIEKFVEFVFYVWFKSRVVKKKLTTVEK